MALMAGTDENTSTSSPDKGMEIVALTRELRVAFGDSVASAAWMRTHSEFLAGRTPLATLREGRFGEVRRRLAEYLAAKLRTTLVEERGVRNQKELR